MSILRKLASETALYGLPSILGRSLNFLLVILHTQVFAPQQTAVMVSLYAIIAFLNVIYTYGMETAYFRFAQDDARKAYATIMSSVLASSIIFSGLMILFASPFVGVLGFEGQGNLIYYTAIIMATDAIAAIPLARLRHEKKAKRFTTIRITNILLNIFFNLFFLLWCKDIYEGKYLTDLQPLIKLIYFPEIGVGYIFLANLLANLALLPMLTDLLLDFRFQFDIKVLKPIWNYGYPILIMGLAGTANQMFDRLALEKLLPTGIYPNRTSQEALGIYGNVYKLSILMNLVIQAFRYAAEPFFFSQAQDKNSPKTFALVMHWFVIACCAIWVVVSVNLDFFGTIFLRRPEYREGLPVVPVLLLGNLFLGIYYNLSIWFKLTDKTYFGTYLTFFGAGINIILNLLLIPYMGYMGCAWAFTLSCLAMTLACYLLGEKNYPIPYTRKKLLFYLILANILILLALQFSFENAWQQAFWQLFLCGTFFGMVFWLEKEKFARKAAFENKRQ
ncbi:MAG: polysaccharide biosynthesis C-terminal domain-containing protein [Verrucomicrobia bacterium]|nr:polysaccharide biosynthesis C-terminal domain-containing protein [Cytophagales bacterium]